MSDSIKGLTVVFTHDLSAERAKDLVRAIEQLRWVAAVEMHVTDIGDHMARVQMDRRWRDKLIMLATDLTEPKD